MSDEHRAVASGVLTYRQRIALIPGGTAAVVVVDVSRQDVAATEVAETTIDLGTSQVPIPFEIEIGLHACSLGHRYAIRATITDAAGDLQWTTDTTHPVDPWTLPSDLGALMLVQVQRTADDQESQSARRIDPTVSNHPDGTTPPQSRAANLADGHCTTKGS